MSDSCGVAGAEEASEILDPIVSTWVDVIKIPTVGGGHFTEDENFINVTSSWSVTDPGKKENVQFQKTFSVLKSSLLWKDGESHIDDKQLVISEGAATPTVGKLIGLSKNGTRKAILVEKAGNNGAGKESTPQQFIQIWSSTTLLKSYDLSELDKHRSVYTGEFGQLVWDDRGDKLAYLAEKKVPKRKPFFSSDVPKDEKSNDDKKDKEVVRGEEYALQQSWGEQMQDLHFSVVVILDTRSDKFSILELPLDQFPTDIQWVGNSSLVGTSYQISDWRLGLIYCTNRESRIFRINTDGTSFCYLSAAGRAAFSPRVRPDGKYVIWQERAVDGPHRRAQNIMGMVIDNAEAASPSSLYVSVPPNTPIYDSFPQNCWNADGTTFFVISEHDALLSLLSMTLIGDKAEAKLIFSSSPGINRLLWINENYMLLARSSLLSSPYLELVEISGEHRRAAITKSIPIVPNNSYKVSHVTGQASIPSILVTPIGRPDTSVPLIVWPHGGPHANFVDTYMSEAAVLMRFGFAFLHVNYIGSTGSKIDETDDLLGKIGTLDVQDTQGIVIKAIRSEPCLNPQNVGVWGGSHGGFLTCHLISQFPDFYKAAVSRNPVCDLNGMIGTSDITDWVYAETGLQFTSSLKKGFIPAAKSCEETEKLFKASPISRVADVKAATLICVGKDDLRVPAYQGLAFYRALRSLGKTTEIRVYPDCHPLSTPPVRLDSIIHAVLWFKKYLKY